MRSGRVGNKRNIDDGVTLRKDLYIAERQKDSLLTQECLQCGNLIGAVAGTKEAIYANCGWKDPCCE